MGSRISHHPILGSKAGREVDFTFDGKRLQGIDGEPIAAALLANGIRIFRKTEKLKQPRSIYCGIGQCNDCVVVVDGVPNVRSCVTALKAGMTIETQKGFGKLGAV